MHVCRPAGGWPPRPGGCRRARRIAGTIRRRAPAVSRRTAMVVSSEPESSSRAPVTFVSVPRSSSNPAHTNRPGRPRTGDPPTTSNPRSRASAAASAASALLPEPAVPTSVITPPKPAAPRSRSAASSPSSADRPTSPMPRSLRRQSLKEAGQRARRPMDAGVWCFAQTVTAAAARKPGITPCRLAHPRRPGLRRQRLTCLCHQGSSSLPAPHSSRSPAQRRETPWLTPQASVCRCQRRA